jgi:hypothetical protein
LRSATAYTPFGQPAAASGKPAGNDLGFAGYMVPEGQSVHLSDITAASCQV